jgi:predicted dehydrogenase
VEGGGRLLGEGVHFFDMLRFLTASDPVRVRSVSPPGKARDEAIVALEFQDGSVGSVVYAGGGAPGLGKERIEVFAGGASFVLDDYRRLEVHGLPKERVKTRAVEKGQREQLDNFFRALRGQTPLGVTSEDGLLATWCAEAAVSAGTAGGAR